MANPDSENENGWIERVKEEGAVPLLEPENCPNGWASPPGDIFRVRGPEYFLTKVKIPGGEYLLKPLGFDWIKGPTKISEVLKNPKNRVRKALDDEFPAGNKPCVWAFNLQVPSKDNYSAIAYFVATEPIPDGSLMDQFLKGDDGFRKSRLKLIANIVKGPWLVRKAVGEQAICVIGRALTCQYYVADNFVEVDIDIGSSMVASAIVHLAFGYLTTLTVDLAFLIESQTESELPERILGAVRFSELNAAAARPVELSSDGSAANSQSSLPTRFWNSIGQGFSNLVSGAQESNSVSSSSHVNGVVDPEHSGKEVQEWPPAEVDSMVDEERTFSYKKEEKWTRLMAPGILQQVPDMDTVRTLVSMCPHFFLQFSRQAQWRNARDTLRKTFWSKCDINNHSSHSCFGIALNSNS